MPEYSFTVESYRDQRVRWYRSWRILLVAAAILAWLPVLLLIYWKLHVAFVWRDHDFYWLPGLSALDREIWERPLLSLTYDLEYYAQILRRLLAVAAALALAFSYHPVFKQGPAEVVYEDYRHAIRRAIYWAMLVFLLLPSIVSELVKDAGITVDGIQFGMIGFPLLLLVADWLSQCEFQQWLILRFNKLSIGACYGLTIFLTALYFFANYYLPQTFHWGTSHVTWLYPSLMSVLLIGFSLLTAFFWRRGTHKPGMSFNRQVNELNPEDIKEVNQRSDEPATRSITELLRRHAAATRKWIIAVLVLIIAFSIALVVVIQSGVLYDPDVYPNPDMEIPVISTRGHFYYGTLVQGFGQYEYELLDPANRFAQEAGNSSSLIVVVHGFNNHPLKARYKFDLAQSALKANGYAGLMAGFSWDADTHHDPFSATGYNTGDDHATKNGAKLASFISDMKSGSPGLKVHLVGYSMGARVVLESLLSLSTDAKFRGQAIQVDSVHLFGASVDNEQVAKSGKYGAAIESSTVAAFNYYSEQDVALGSFYWVKQADRSLGQSCIDQAEERPSNYYSVDASAELVTFDSEYQIVEDKLGRNHKGYLGAKDTAGRLIDDGAMDVLLGNIM